MRILIELHRSRQADDPFAFCAGRQEYVRHTAGGGVATATLDWSAELLGDLESLRRPGGDPAIAQQLGDALQRFMSQLDWSSDAAALAAAVGRHESATVVLRLGAAELFALPWELLTAKGSGLRLGELARVNLQYEWPESESAPESPLPRREGGRILFAWSAAAGAVPAAAHQRAIAAACAAGYHPFDPERDVLAHASLVGLAARLEAAAQGEPAAILHILCHGVAIGSTVGLAFDGSEENLGVDVVDGSRLRQLLSQHAARIRLVILCACGSASSGNLGNHLGGLAQALHRAGLQTVVASRFPISAAGSTLFAETLYDRLLHTKDSLELAVCAARQKLRLEPSFDWASVQLYARCQDGCDTRPLIFRPYRGLLAFGPEHAQFFFGRQRETQELISELGALETQGRPRLLIVAGASGTGKSSLVLAAAGPRLCEDGQRACVVIRPGEAGLKKLADALAHQTSSRIPILLIVDQLEEIFTRLPEEERQLFVRKLWTMATEPERKVSIIATLRVDFLGRCGELAIDADGTRLDRIVYDERHRVFIAQLGRDELRDSLEQPAARVGLALEPGLCERILGDVEGQPGALPLLEYALDLLWLRREGRQLTQAAYTALNGVGGALKSEAEKLVSALDDEQRRLARRLLVSLVEVRDASIGDSRRRALLSELRPSAQAQAAAFDKVLEQLVSARLLVRGESNEMVTIEVAHEALIREWQTLREWIQADRDKLIALAKLRAWTVEWQQFPSALLRDDQLGYAHEVQRNHGTELDADMQKLLAASDLEAQQLAREVLVRRWAAAAAVLLLALALALAGLLQQMAAKRMQESSRLTMEQALQIKAVSEQATRNAVELERQMQLAKQQLKELKLQCELGAQP